MLDVLLRDSDFLCELEGFNLKTGRESVDYFLGIDRQHRSRLFRQHQFIEIAFKILDFNRSELLLRELASAVSYRLLIGLTAMSLKFFFCFEQILICLVDNVKGDLIAEGSLNRHVAKSLYTGCSATPCDSRRIVEISLGLNTFCVFC